MAVRKSLEKRGIELVLDEYIDTIPAPGEKVMGATARSGRTIEADLVVSNYG